MMNDEIKEKIKAYYIANDIDKIIDYITNLQEENEKVHKDFAELSERYFFTKSRCEKARGMIKFISYNSERPLTETELNKVYNILGGDEE